MGVFRFDKNDIYLRNNKLFGTSLFYDFYFYKDIFFKIKTVQWSVLTVGVFSYW